jgi:hypothetical protein
VGYKVWDGGLGTRLQTTEAQNGIGAFMVYVFFWLDIKNLGKFKQNEKEKKVEFAFLISKKLSISLLKNGEILP